MAKTRLIEPVIRFCAIISNSSIARRWAIERIENQWDSIEEQSELSPFESGNYYRESMGPDLKKVIVATRSIADPASLADWKHETNRWEQEYAQMQLHPVRRPLNLDCGYLSQAKLVLATIKDRDHRIYLRDGIFAEVTMNYIAKKWTAHRWSYPSYQSDAVVAFAGDCRRRLRTELARTGQIRTAQKDS